LRCFNACLISLKILFIGIEFCYFVRYEIAKKMERRTALKQLIIVAGGAAMLPACVRNIKQGSLDLKNLKVSADHETLLAEIAETIIPSTETPGAKDLKLHHFVLRMIDDCYEQEQQKQFVSGLAAFDELTEKKKGDSFIDLSKGERESLLKELEVIKNGEDKEEKEQPVNRFYSMLKDLTVQGYLTAEYVMTNQLYYNMIPGKFKGCVEVKDPKDYKTILG
jgi:hypothetical protein